MKISAKKSALRNRQLRIESLEERQLLSVTAADFAAIKSQYEDLELGNFADYNVIEITAAQLNQNTLQNAVNTAGTTAKKDLIVVRTTNTQNTINLTGKLNIDINSDSFGSVNIVSLGTKPLTLSNNGVRIQHSNNEDSSGITVGLAGLTISGSQTGGLQSFGDGNNVIVTKCTITDNFEIEEAAGINQMGGTMYVSHSTISNNFSGDENEESAGYRQTGHGGGISTSGGGDMTINDCIITGNTALSEGGGIANYSSTVTITNSRISGNYGGNSGGGIANYGFGSSDMTISNSVISDNESSGGGGINTWARCLIVNSLIASNKAEYGGGIYLDSDEAPLTVVQSTITANTATYGVGGIVDSGEWTSVITFFANTIIAGNTVLDEEVWGPGYNKDIDSLKGRVGGKVVGTNNLSSFTNWTEDSTPRTNFVYDSSKPLFVNAAHGDYRLAANSQAIDKGNNSDAADITKDLAGNARIQGTAVDIGAYEYQQLIKPTAPGNLTAKVLPMSNGKLPVQINWDAASNATHYILHRWEEGDYKADGKTKNWKVIYAMKPAEQIPSGGTLSTFQVINSDVSKVTAKQVQYLVRGYNGDIPGESVNIFVTLNSTPVIPTAPKNLTAKVLPVSNGKLPVQINWNAAAGATHYILHRWEEGDYKADGKTKNWKVIYAMKPAGQIPSGGLLSDFQVVNSDVSKVTAKRVQYLVRGYNGDIPGESASVFVTVN